MNTVSNSNFILNVMKEKYEQFTKEHASQLEEKVKAEQTIFDLSQKIEILNQDMQNLLLLYRQKHKEVNKMQEEFNAICSSDSFKLASEQIAEIQNTISITFAEQQEILNQVKDMTDSKNEYETLLEKESEIHRNIISNLPCNSHGIALNIASKYPQAAKDGIERTSRAIEILQQLLGLEISFDIILNECKDEFFISEIQIGNHVYVESLFAVIREKVGIRYGEVQGREDEYVPVLNFESIQDIYNVFGDIPKQKMFVNTILNEYNKACPQHIFIVNDNSEQPETDFIKISAESFPSNGDEIKFISLDFSEFPYVMKA